MTPRLIAAIRDLPKVCKHLHLPVQSGSTRLLKTMRRRYTRADYLALVERLRGEVPGIALSTDMIVGFPGETAEDFEDTLSLDRQRPLSQHVLVQVSERPNTLAAKRHADDVPEAEKARRIVMLQALQRDVQLELHAAMVGQTVDVLADASSRRRETELSGRTTGNTVVNFPGDAAQIGTLVPVVIRRAGPNSLWGEAEPTHAD